MHCLPKHATLCSRVAPALHPNLLHVRLYIPHNAALGAQTCDKKVASTAPTIHPAVSAGKRFSVPGAAAAASCSTQQATHQQGLEALIIHSHEQLVLLEQLVNGLHAADLQAGPQLLELLSAFEVVRSNLLRPAGYFADFLQQPEEQQAWMELMQHVGQLTEAVYANRTVLQLLLGTVAQGLQQLAAVAATTAAGGQSSPDLQDGNATSSNHTRWGACGTAWQSQFVEVQHGLAVAPEAVAAAAELAQHACELLQTSLGGTHPPTSGASVSLAALQTCLTAVDAAVNSTTPSTSQHSTDRQISSNSCVLQQLMVCRRLLAVSWLPPLAAAAAAAIQQQNSASQNPDLVQSPAVADAMHHTTADGGRCSLPHHCAVHPTTRQLLRSAVATLSAVSNSTVGSSTVAPLLLMTDDQAAVIRPLLKDAGLEYTVSGAAGAAAKQPRQQASTPHSTAKLPPGSSSDTIGTPWVLLHAGPVQQQLPQNQEAPGAAIQALQTSNSDPGGKTSCNLHGKVAGEAFPALQWAPITAAGFSGGVLVRPDAALQVHEGTDGVLHLGDGLFSMTEHAEQLLQHWQQEQQQEQEQQDASPTATADEADCHSGMQAGDKHSGSSSAKIAPQLLLPAELPLQLLRLSNDVIQVLLRHHPHPGVRQQIHRSGLLPLLQLQQQVLTVVLSLRQRLAYEHAVTSYSQLMLSGSCLGTAAVAEALLNQLQPVFRAHAEAENQELQQISSRKARAQGRWGKCDLQPWDLAQAIQQLAQQVTELDWGRDFAPYFTLPGLIDRVDSLLASACGLRLLSADKIDEAAAAEEEEEEEEGGMVEGPEQQQQQQRRRQGWSAVSSSIQPWGNHVLHLILVDAEKSGWPDQAQRQQQVQPQQQQLVLGHVFIELVPGWGFPSCSLLQLPAVPAGGSNGSSSSSSSSANSSGLGMSADGPAAPPAPGSVAIRLPIPTAKPSVGFGSRQPTVSQQQQQQQQQQVVLDEPPLLLPGPAALQALLHELGHAVSYLCPYGTLQQQLMSSTSICTAGSSKSSNNSSSSSGTGGHAVNGSAEGWLLNSNVGVHGLCVLAGPADGLDIRELSSHVFEHWVRHPASLVALSCHERLGVPLPQRAALQLPQMLLAASGACSSMHLHHLLLEAAADLELHSKGISDNSLDSSSSRLRFWTTSSTDPKVGAAAVLELRSAGASGCSCSNSSHSQTTASTQEATTVVPMLELQEEAPTATVTAVAQLGQGLANLVTEDLSVPVAQHQTQQQQQQQCASMSSTLQDVRTALQQQLVPPGGALLEEVDELAACGPVGGAKAAYIMAKLLAAATWKALRLEQQPTGKHSSHGTGLGLDALASNDQGGRWLRDVLLSGGSFQPGHWTVMQLLAAGSDVLEPVFGPMQYPWFAGNAKQQAGAPAQGSNAEQLTEVGGTAGVVDEASAERHVVVGWMPNLVHDVYQDVDLV